MFEIKRKRFHNTAIFIFALDKNCFRLGYFIQIIVCISSDYLFAGYYLASKYDFWLGYTLKYDTKYF